MIWNLPTVTSPILTRLLLSVSCDVTKGPTQWESKHCDAGEQSPIDLCDAKDYSSILPNLQPSSSYMDWKSFTFKSDGQAYIDASSLGLSLAAGDLAFINNRQTTASIDTDNADGDSKEDTGIDYPKWNFAQAHFHW